MYAADANNPNLNLSLVGAGAFKKILAWEGYIRFLFSRKLSEF